MIDNIRLQNFRSYKDESFEFDHSVNIVVGPNGAGKTNLLEAILFLARGQSYRARPVELLRFSCDWARLDGDFGDMKRTAKIRSIEALTVAEFEIDNKTHKRLGAQRFIPVVLFEPNDLQLLMRGPETRREYFDGILSRTDPKFTTLKNTYIRTLRQRNALLKQGVSKISQLFVWNVQLSEAGGRLAQKRLELVRMINGDVENYYQDIAQKPSSLSVSYQTALDHDNYGSSFLKKLESSQELDYLRGFTGSGPHRDDFTLDLNDQEAASTASRGETRTILLALKIFEMQLQHQTFDQKPLLLLDDVFSELDGRRRRYLVESLKEHQAFITTTDADAVVEHFAGGHNLIAL